MSCYDIIKTDSYILSYPSCINKNLKIMKMHLPKKLMMNENNHLLIHTSIV